MGMLHCLCEEEEWDKALDRINIIAERIIAIDNFGMWCSKVVDADDILYALSVLSDDIHEAIINKHCRDLDDDEDVDDCDEDEDDFDEDELHCETCTYENCGEFCPYDHELNDEKPLEEFGGWSC